MMSKMIPSRGCVTCSAVQESSSPTTTAENKEEGKRLKPAAKSLPSAGVDLEGSFLKNGWPYSFWAFFPNGELTGPKGFSLCSYGRGASTVEPFLVDEKKITAKHVVFWVEKRLAAQGIIPVWKE
ncbi:hypothetical protein Gorai_002020 [Gossypium raimondii]|uniref:Uncharacterized protein n=1 Tax=Gossypium raimondii TaxID=29730 RepID=A0A7J8QQ89_GOSRA|nr:hypothetical protein [Gossypium raimondii]